MPAYLDSILAAHRAAAAADTRDVEAAVEQAERGGATRSFADAIAAASTRYGMAVISEIKRRSPSKGDLDPDLDPATVADRCSLAALVEVHDETELHRALDAGAALVGVNQRDLRTFEVDRQRALSLGAAIPAGVLAVAESGIRDVGDVARLAEAGFQAVLVGETLVRSADRRAAVAELLGVRL